MKYHSPPFTRIIHDPFYGELLAHLIPSFFTHSVSRKHTNVHLRVKPQCTRPPYISHLSELIPHIRLVYVWLKDQHKNGEQDPTVTPCNIQCYCVPLVYSVPFFGSSLHRRVLFVIRHKQVTKCAHQLTPANVRAQILCLGGCRLG